MQRMSTGRHWIRISDLPRLDGAEYDLRRKTDKPGRELRTPVTFYKRAITSGTGGFQTASVGDKIAHALVRWENADGPEVWDAAAVNAENPATVLARR